MLQGLLWIFVCDTWRVAGHDVYVRGITNNPHNGRSHRAGHSIPQQVIVMPSLAWADLGRYRWSTRALWVYFLAHSGADTFIF